MIRRRRTPPTLDVAGNHVFTPRMAKADLDKVTPLLMDLDETAKLLGISRNSAYDLIRNGNFPVRAFQIGKRWKVNRAEFDAYIAGTATRDPDGE